MMKIFFTPVSTDVLKSMLESYADQGCTVHLLKSIQPYFDLFAQQIKGFELRKDDRNFKVGDILVQREWILLPDSRSRQGAYSDLLHVSRVDYILSAKDFSDALQPGYVAMNATLIGCLKLPDFNIPNEKIYEENSQ